MAAVMIGVDPHKGSHTAVVIGTAEEVPGQVRVRACAAQAQRLLAWAAAWPERTWAVEGAGELGHLLAQQLVAAGERVLDVPPKLAARVRLPGSGATDKNDPNDARSVAIAALRPGACPPVRADDHAAVLKIWAKRHRDLSRSRNQVVCRMHAVLCQLIPGVSKRITAGQAARILEQAEPHGAAGMARWVLAEQFLTDLRRIDTQRRDVEKKLAAAVRASGTTVTEIFGVGPAVVLPPGGLRVMPPSPSPRSSRKFHTPLDIENKEESICAARSRHAERVDVSRVDVPFVDWVGSGVLVKGPQSRLWPWLGEKPGLGFDEDAAADQALELGADVLGVLGRDGQIQGHAEAAGPQGPPEVGEGGQDLLVGRMLW